MSAHSYTTLKSLAKLLRAFKGMSYAECLRLEKLYTCLVWSDGMEWNVELELLEQAREDGVDYLKFGVSVQEMDEASWTNFFSRPLELDRSITICQTPSSTELFLSPQVQSLQNQYGVMRMSQQGFLIRTEYALEALMEDWRDAKEGITPFEDLEVERFNELLGLIRAHIAHMQELVEDYSQKAQSSGLALRLPSIEEETQAQIVTRKLTDLLDSELGQHPLLDVVNIQQLILDLRLRISPHE